MDQQPNNPLHGKSLRVIMGYLFEKYGWDGLADEFKMNCFHHDPSMNSTLKFLRKTPWARKKIEDFYIREIQK